MKRLLLVVSLCAMSTWGQSTADPKQAAIQRYLGVYYSQFKEFDGMDPGARPATDVDVFRELLPTRRPDVFPAYIRETRFNRSAALTSLAQQVTDGQMNKMVTGTAGGSGSTSLLSNAVAADILSLATEYGAVTQTNSGNTTTLRANALGITGLLAGNPYLGCTSLAVGDCTEESRILRGFSASLSVDTPGGSGTSTVNGTNGVTGAPAAANILASGYRMSAWGVRFDWSHKSLYDLKQMIPDFAKQWVDQMKAVSTSSTEKELDAAIPPLMKDLGTGWEGPFLDALQKADSDSLESTLAQQLDSLIDARATRDPDFMTKVQRAQNAVLASFAQRDAILQKLQSKNFSTEFNSRHPLGQPNMSNVRLIVSHQPSKAPLRFTANFAAEWYDAVPTGVKQGRLRDLQAAVQADRRLGDLPKLGTATLTLAYYSQWMKDNALITIPAGNTAPGTGIVLPGAASTLLATKGNIDIFQAKVTVPIKGGTVKVPISFTWSNRTELINESEKRGQIGLTLDLDSIFQKVGTPSGGS